MGVTIGEQAQKLPKAEQILRSVQSAHTHLLGHLFRNLSQIPKSMKWFHTQGQANKKIQAKEAKIPENGNLAEAKISYL